MKNLPEILIVILALSVKTIYSQEYDYIECTTNDIVSDDGLNLPLPYRNESEQYRAFYEQVVTSGNEKYGYDVREFYDGLKNIGVNYITDYGYDHIYYSYFESDEILYSSFGACYSYTLEQYIELTSFQVITVDGKIHIATPLTLLSHGVHQNIAYLGSKDRYVRGIPVRQWLACVKLHDNLQTAKIIISYSNSEKWSPANQAPGYESIPVHINFNANGFGWNPVPINDEYNIFDFRPGPFSEEFLYVPPGTYCSNRRIKKEFPTLPKSYSFISNVMHSSKVDGNLIGTFKNEYDLDKHLIKMDYIGSKDGYSRVVNLNSRIEYNIHKITGSCFVTSLNKSQELEFDIFRVDEDPPYEYIGQRTVRGVKTDVWITYRNNYDTNYFYYEWYFMADEWSSMNLDGTSKQDPVLLIIYNYYQVDNKTTYEISDFRRNTFNAYNFDLSVCRSLARKHLKFTIADKENYETMAKNKVEFKEATLVALEKYAKIPRIRISSLEISYSSGVVSPKFVLLDKTNSSIIHNELDLDESYFLLIAQINSGRFKITFKDANKKEITVQPDPESLTNLDLNYGQNVYNNNEKSVSSGLDDGLFIGLLIAGVLIGILTGIISGLYYHSRKLKKAALNSPPIMSIRNPVDNL